MPSASSPSKPSSATAWIKPWAPSSDSGCARGDAGLSPL
eukprot:gene45456-56619_t